jgi:ribonucleoside-triphosphate reductase (thioredoxin)
MDNYQSYVHKSRYARYLPELQRRETWEETVDRYVGFFSDKLDAKTQERVRTAIINMDVMPSMRAMMTAGKALDRDNVAGFNCSYIPIDSPRSFDELMYILLCGTGVGFSVERQYITKLPEVSEDFHPTDTIIHVADSKIGWAKAFRELISLLYSGQVPSWDTSTIRPAGAPLKTFGGRASGPEPLLELFKFTVELFKEASGRKLNSIECHDLCCKVAQVVVVGGVRRSALISLSNLTDDRLRRAKHGQWWLDEPQRALANNSVCYTEKPDFEAFMNEWVALYESKSGERGMFSRVASQKQAAKNGRRGKKVKLTLEDGSTVTIPYNQRVGSKVTSELKVGDSYDKE